MVNACELCRLSCRLPRRLRHRLPRRSPCRFPSNLCSSVDMFNAHVDWATPWRYLTGESDAGGYMIFIDTGGYNSGVRLCPSQ